jgi:hypothetical protein
MWKEQASLPSFKEKSKVFNCCHSLCIKFTSCSTDLLSASYVKNLTAELGMMRRQLAPFPCIMPCKRWKVQKIAAEITMRYLADSKTLAASLSAYAF